MFPDIVELCDTGAVFCDRAGRTASHPTRLTTSGSPIDDRAVFSVLQLGAIVPPLSPWQDVRRLVSPYRRDRREDSLGRPEIGPAPRPRSFGTREQSDEIQRSIDSVLRKRLGDREDPVVLFSGGVDSSFIASRLAALGYSDSLLINYSFGDDDPESALAEAIADELGLNFERVDATGRPLECLNEPGVVYPQPFADHSTVPTSDLARAIVDKLAGRPRIILDGTGADGAFGLAKKIRTWRALSAGVPAFARRAALRVYQKILWHRNNRLEYALRILGRSQMPILSGFIAQNALAGCFYRNEAAGEVDRLLEEWIRGFTGDTEERRIVAADLALTCAGVFAQKAKPIFDQAGHCVLYPFLEPEIVQLALSLHPAHRSDEPKAALKLSLAQHLPHDMVYRQKSGFVDPHGSAFFDEHFIEMLRAACETSGPISHLLEARPLLRACDFLASKKTLPPQTQNCLWAVAFTDRWYRTTPAARANRTHRDERLERGSEQASPSPRVCS